jgi:glycosyltransferase involved in cell wall biosynthesis
MAGLRYPGKLAVQQRVLTTYRAPFFDTLARACEGGLNVCAGLPRLEESIATANSLHAARYSYTPNLHLFSGAFYLCFQRGLVKWLNECDPDVLILEANPRYLATPAAIRWMKRRSRPVLGWGLGAPLAPKLNSLARTLGQAQRRFFLRKFDAMITYSSRGADEYAALGFPRDRIFIAPNAATSRPAWPIPDRPASPDRKRVILFVGRLQARKRVDLLLRACAALPERLQPRLVIVGEGPEQASLKALAKTVYPATEFAGAKRGQDLVAHLVGADLFVLPGTGGLAVQEAMAYGLPVIMGQGDGTNADLVRAGNGWQIPSDNPAALTETLTAALSDPSRLREMGAESYRIVKEEINLDKMVDVFVEALNTISR